MRVDRMIRGRRGGGAKRVGVLELIAFNAPAEGRYRWLSAMLVRQLYSIMPQVVAAWCRRRGHRVAYATYYGQAPPESLLPDDLDVVFVCAATQVSGLAYALARLYRRRGTLTVLGGPHARCFPDDALRFFDIVVGGCDDGLVEEIVNGRIDPPALVTSPRPLTEIPSVRERLPELGVSAFSRGRPGWISGIAMLTSVGCPHACGFCCDFATEHVVFSRDRLAEDLGFVSLPSPVRDGPTFTERADPPV